MAEYKAFIGVVAWDAQESTTNTGKKVKNFPIRLLNSENDTRVQVALWEEKAALQVERGDFILVEGQFVTGEYKGEPQYKVNATRIVRLIPQPGSPAEPTKAETPRKKVSFG